MNSICNTVINCTVIIPLKIVAKKSAKTSWLKNFRETICDAARASYRVKNFPLIVHLKNEIFILTIFWRICFVPFTKMTMASLPAKKPRNQKSSKETFHSKCFVIGQSLQFQSNFFTISGDRKNFWKKDDFFREIVTLLP